MSLTLVAASAPPMNPEVIAGYARRYEVEVHSVPLVTPEDAAAHTVGADGVLVSTNPLPSAVIAAMAPSVRLIARAGVGIDAIDLDAAERRGIAVFHTPDYCVPEVATHTLALVLALNRRLFAADRVARADWTDWRSFAPIVPMSELSVGLVGYGRIGRAVGELLLPLAGRVLVHDPYVRVDRVGVESVPTLADLLGASDIVSLHLPLNAETTALMGPEQFSSMRPGAAFVNVSRGGLVDESALAAALSSGRLSGAALDVLANEPPPAGAALLGLANVILTPHNAWYSTASEQRVWTMTFEGVLDALQGRPLRHGRIVPVG
jgi:D-3-phosphoglycerate dehydrogenase